MFGLRSIFTAIAPDFLKVVTKADLESINRQLEEQGLPKWFLGFGLGGAKILNPCYKLYPTPRFTFTMKGPRLNQVYLRPFAQKGEWIYSIFWNKFYSNVPFDDMPRVIDGPELVFQF
jgi:hypothetical protein